MTSTVQIDSKLGEFSLLIDTKDLPLVDTGLRVHRSRVKSGLIIYTPTASKNGFNRRNQDCRFVHLLVAEKCLLRPLKSIEIVHHLNGYKFDCRRSNLLVCKQSEHIRLHMYMGIEYAKNNFQSPLNDDQFQLLHKLLGRNTQDISGIQLVV